MQPHLVEIIPSDSSGSVTRGLWQASELSAMQTTKLITKGFWFDLWLHSANNLYNTQKID